MRLPTKAQSLTGFLIAVLAIALSAAPAAAHTGFEASSPGDGEVVAESVSEITLTFTGEASPAGEGFVVLDPDGTIREPDQITTSDNLTWVLRFNEPLAGGKVGVRWMVAAPDAHPIEGSFSFTVTAEAPHADGESGGNEESPLEETEDTSEPSALDPEREQLGASVDLESFLDTGDAQPVAAAPIAAIARILSLVGAVVVIGGAAFAAFGLRGDPVDVHAVLAWVRGGGALVIAGAAGLATSTTAALAGEWPALGSPGDLSEALWSSAGLAIALRALGGFAVVSNIGTKTRTASAIGDPVIAARQLATVGAGHSAPPPGRAPDEPFVYAEDHAWDHRVALGGLFGVAMVAASFIFDGHTASEGPRWLHAIANLVHVTSASVWAGGVAMLALTIHRRYRNDRPTKALQLAIRFSVVATIALVAAGLAGLALSIVVLDSISDVWSTPWGRLLMAKVLVVAAAAAGGAYNHRVVVPTLDQDPEDQPTIDRFRKVVTFEAVALVAVAILTAFLIAASAT